jgi:hypothetical protein
MRISHHAFERALERFGITAHKFKRLIERIGVRKVYKKMQFVWCNDVMVTVKEYVPKMTGSEHEEIRKDIKKHGNYRKSWHKKKHKTQSRAKRNNKKNRW